MPTLSIAFLYIASGLLNLIGVMLLKNAVVHQNLLQATLGAACWCATALPFLALLNRDDSNLAVVSVSTSSCGFLAVIAMSVYYGQPPQGSQICGLILMISGLICVAMPTS